MNVIICDDDGYYRNALNDSVHRWTDACRFSLTVVTHCFFSTEELLKAWKNGLVMDVVFLDIQIPGELSGLALAKKIRETDSQIPIVFVTNYAEFACDGYSVNALRYLKKPVDDLQVFECLDIAYRQWEFAQASSIFIDIRKQKIALPFKQIVYIEARAHYLTIYRTNGDSVEIRCKVGEILQKLPGELFVRCHRGFVVNLLYVRNLTKTLLILAGNIQIPLGTKYENYVFESFKRYYQGTSL